MSATTALGHGLLHGGAIALGSMVLLGWASALAVAWVVSCGMTGALCVAFGGRA